MLTIDAFHVARSTGMLKYVSQFHFKFGVGPCHEPVTVLFVRGFPLILFSVAPTSMTLAKAM